MAKLTRLEAKKMAKQAGISFKQDYHKLRGDKVDFLLSLCRAVGYKKPKKASGSTGRYFYYYLRKA